MEFTKILQNCRPTQGFTNMDVTEAQLESILEAGTSVPLPEDYWNHFHIALLPQSTAKHEAPVIALAAKKGSLSSETIFFNAGLILGGMILQTTNLLLGFRHVTKEELLESGRELPKVPEGYEEIRLLAVGYPIEGEEKREAFYGAHAPSPTITKGLD